MAARILSGRPDHARPLAVLDRLAPRPPRELVADQIARHTATGDVVLDLHGRGGWVARQALDVARRAISFESGPLARLLAELVLRPPDVDHLDAAWDELAVSPRHERTLRAAVESLFATSCPTCGSDAVADELTWVATASPETAGERDRLLRKLVRCGACADGPGGGETRPATVDEADVALALATPPDLAEVRAALRQRFPVPEDGAQLVTDLLGLHTDRQLVGLARLLEGIERELRAEPIEAALRLGFLQAVLPASRLGLGSGRLPSLRIASGRVSRPGSGSWRERSPWLAFEEGFVSVRGFVASLHVDIAGPVPARLGSDLASLADGHATAVMRVSTPAALGSMSEEAAALGERGAAPDVRLAIGQPPRRPTQERTALAFHGTAWALGRDAAAGLPVESLFGPGFRAPWSWQSAALRRTLGAVAPLLAADGRAALIVDEGGPDGLVAAALGAASAGYRLVSARLAEPGGPDGGLVELLPPGAALRPGPRTRANVDLPAVTGGAGDPDLVPARGLFAAPERVDSRRFSALDTARVVTETAVDVLLRRGEPTTWEWLLGAILVELDRAGPLRRLALTEAAAGAPDATATGAPDPVARLLTLVLEELRRPSQRQLVELEPDQWWLRDREDESAAATPLADRVEWAVYSLLSTVTSITEPAFAERIAALFSGPDRADEALVRACLESYRVDLSPDEIGTAEDLVRRSHEHTDLLADLADGGHRLGMQVWLSTREQGRRVGGGLLADRLDAGERRVHLPRIARGHEEALEAVDAVWYVPQKAAFMFEVEWTAMLGEPILRRHGRIPPDERLVRFLVIPPERTELVRHKLERSALLRRAFRDGNWHVLKWNHLRSFLGAEEPDLGALEPLLGLDPLVERTGDQLPLFDPAQ